MNCVDFDKHFQTYLRQWTQQNMGKFKNVDEMEAEVPEVYLRWLNEPCDWLSGRTPGVRCPSAVVMLRPSMRSR